MEGIGYIQYTDIRNGISLVSKRNQKEGFPKNIGLLENSMLGVFFIYRCEKLFSNYSETFIKTDQILNSVKFVADLVIINCKVEPFSEIKIV